MRTGFQNRPGVVYDPADKTRVFAEDMQAIADYINVTGIANLRIDKTGITVDGGGSPISSGSKGFITIPFNATITNWYVVADQNGDVVFDIKRSGASIINAGNKPTLSGASSANGAVTAWESADITAGDILEFVINSVATLTRATLVLKLNK